MVCISKSKSTLLTLTIERKTYGYLEDLVTDLRVYFRNLDLGKLADLNNYLSIG
jgi:hypothetical protein